MKRIKLKIFRAGNYGEKGEWPVSRLRDVVMNLKPEYHEPPICVGHPADNAPARGWVETLDVTGDMLSAVARDVQDAFYEDLKARRYAKVSAAFYVKNGNEYTGPVPALRHVGFVPVPHVKGLPAVELAELDDGSISVEFSGSIEFSEENIKTEGGQPMTEDEKKEQERLILEAKTKAEADAKAASDAAFAEKIKVLEAAKTAAEAQAAEFAEQVKIEAARADAKVTGEMVVEGLAAKQAEEAQRLADLQSQLHHRDCAAFADDMVREGRIFPYEKSNLIAVMSAIAPEITAEFSEEGKAVKGSLFNAVKAFIKQRPSFLKLRELTRESGVTFSELDAQAEYRSNPHLAGVGISPEQWSDLKAKKQG